MYKLIKKNAKRNTVNSSTVSKEEFRNFKPLQNCNSFSNSIRLRPSSVFPRKMRVTLFYTEQISISQTSSPISTYQYYGNNVYDPNYTGTGGQPPWYDTLVAIYNQWFVHSSEISVDIVPVSGGTSLTNVVFPTRNRTITGGDIEDYASFWRASSGEMGDYASGSAENSYLHSKASTEEVYGIPLLITNSNFYGGIAGPPTNVWYWYLAFGQLQAQNNVKCNIVVRIKYDVEFFSLTNVGDF